MSKFNIEDVVLLYKGTPTFEDGAVCQIIDRDPNDESYIVADLRDIGKADRDVNVILRRHTKWVKSEHMQKLEFDKLEEDDRLHFTAIQIFIIMAVTMSLLGIYVRYF